MQKSRLYAHRDHNNTIYSIRMYQNLLFFRKNGQKWPFFGQSLSFFGFGREVEDLPSLF